LSGSDGDGWALYLGGNLFLGNWTLSAEFKSYSEYELFTVSDSGQYLSQRMDFIRPPTLEPEDMEVKNNYDVTGARLELDWRPGGGDTLIFASYAGFRAYEMDLLVKPATRWIYNANLGAEQDFLDRRGRARLDCGIREEVPDYAGGDHHHLIYLNAFLKLPLAARHSLEFNATSWLLHEHRMKDTMRGKVTLDYSWSPWGSIGVILGYSGSKDLAEFSGDVRQMFLAGSLTVNLFDYVVVRLLAGQLRGGPVCVGGACRILPPFSGVRFEPVVRL